MDFIKKLITRFLSKETSKIDELYQRHAGEECYLFGDGASIKWMDLENFKDKKAIVGGFMVYHKDFKKLEVPYAAIIEPNWFWPIVPYGGFKKMKILIHRAHYEYRKTMRDCLNTVFFINVSNFPVTFFKNSIYISRWHKPVFAKNNPFLERADAHEGTFKFQVSLAIFMGFKKAYLVGHDYTHSPARIRHFYEKGEGYFEEKDDFNKEFITYAKQYIELETITIDSPAANIKAVTYKEFTGQDPVFKENTELVPIIKLKSLATWHDYKIF